MIKVNLLKPKGGAVEGVAVGGFDAVKKASQIDFFKKLIVIILAPGLLYMYESNNLELLAVDSQKASAELATERKKLAGLKKVEKTAKELQARIKETEKKINAIKELSKNRLREIKAFDTLQAIVDEKIWFETLAYANQELDINGYAVSDDDLTVFVKSLEEKPYFDQVLLKRSTDKKVEGGVIKSFSITGTVVSGQ